MRANGPGQSALLLTDVIDILNKLHIPYAIIGAFAASFYGIVRASIDADAVISLSKSKENIEDLLTELKKLKVTVTHRKGDTQDPIAGVINIEDDFKNRADLLLDILGMKEDAFLRVHETVFMDSSINIIGAEDFIAMKIFAGNEKDINDAIGVLKISFEEIDLNLLKELTLNYGKDELKKLETLLNNLS